ncbi:MAG: hypothetical protein AB1543_00720 [Candidatus Bipolaricaulota bacterium]
MPVKKGLGERVGRSFRNPGVGMLLSIVAALAAGLTAAAVPGVEMPVAFLMALVAAALPLLIQIAWAVTPREAHQQWRYEIHDDQAAALREAGNLVKGAHVVWAMWTAMSYTAELKQYYRETMSIPGCKSVMRIIDLDIPPMDICDHLEANWATLASKTYEIRFIRSLHFELLLVDYTKRAGVFLPAGPGYGYLVLTGDEELAGCVRGLMDLIVEKSTPFPAGDFSDNFDREEVMSWLTGARGKMTTE